jgi:hypothetical protein
MQILTKATRKEKLTLSEIIIRVGQKGWPFLEIFKGRVCVYLLTRSWAWETQFESLTSIEDQQVELRMICMWKPKAFWGLLDYFSKRKNQKIFCKKNGSWCASWLVQPHQGGQAWTMVYHRPDSSIWSLVGGPSVDRAHVLSCRPTNMWYMVGYAHEQGRESHCEKKNMGGPWPSKERDDIDMDYGICMYDWRHD